MERIDLSHNEMPVLTKDILLGTKHLKHLNVSYNFLNDIRRGKTSIQFCKLQDKDICYSILYYVCYL